MFGRSIRIPLAVVGLFASLGASQAHAGSITIDVAGIYSNGAWGNPSNTVEYLNVGAFNEIIGITDDVYVTSFAPSLLTELSVHFTPDDDSSVGGGIAPAFRQYYSGSFHSSGAIPLEALGIAFSVGADGLLKVEFSNGVDHNVGGPEGRWDSGWITFETRDAIPSAVPEPSSYAMMALGLAGLGVATRRRSKVVAQA